MTGAAGAAPTAEAELSPVFLAALLLGALSLRPVFASISPVATDIERSTGLSAALVGLLTTLPLVCFALLAPLGHGVAARLGLWRTVEACLLLVIGGTAIRLARDVGFLFVGTVMAAMGVAVANVVIPVAVRGLGAHRRGLATGLYTMCLSGGAAIAGGVTVPAQRALHAGWRTGLFVWVAIPVAGLLAARAVHDAPAPAPAAVRSGASAWRTPWAWWLAAFMGIQSLQFYCTLAWLPTILQASGVSALDAGWLLAAANAAGTVAALSVPIVISVASRARQTLLAITAASAGGFILLASAGSSGALLAAVLIGTGQGGTIALALSLITTRSTSSGDALALSAMVQGVGYACAAPGPALLGLLYSLTGGWNVPVWVLAVTAVPELVVGLVALGPTTRPASL